MCFWEVVSIKPVLKIKHHVFTFNLSVGYVADKSQLIQKCIGIDSILTLIFFATSLVITRVHQYNLIGGFWCFLDTGRSMNG